MTEAKKNGIGKTWIVVTIIVAITGILLILSVNAKNTFYNIPSSTVEKGDNTPHTTLEFSEARIASNSGTYEVDIRIDSGPDKIKLAQLEMTYNPKQLTRVDINPGDFIINSMILQKSIDPVSGRIKFWISSPDNSGVSGKGNLARVSFIKIGSGSAKINFLPKTSVSGVDSSQSILKSMTNAVINPLPKPTKMISSPNRVALPTRTPSPIPTRIKVISPVPSI